MKRRFKTKPLPKLAVEKATIAFAFFKYVKRLPEETAERKTKELIRSLSGAEYVVAISRAKELFFRPTKADLEFIRRENAVWEAVDAESLEKFPY